MLTEIKIETKNFPWNQKPSFKAGQKVKIVDPEKVTNSIYTVRKIKKSYDGTLLYLLESESNPVKLLYYESDKSHLEKVD